MTVATAAPSADTLIDPGEQRRLAAAFMAQIGALVVRERAVASGLPVPFPGLLDPNWVSGLPLPIGDDRAPGQNVALARGLEFSRYTTAAELAAADEASPATRVYESMHTSTPGAWWFKTVVDCLTRLTRLEASLTVYESVAASATLKWHRDLFTGILVQIAGEKVAQLRLADGTELEWVMRPGGVYWLPDRVWHSMTTPVRSVHMAFVLLTEDPPV